MLTQENLDLIRVCQYSIDALRRNDLHVDADPLYAVLAKTLVASVGMETAEKLLVDGELPAGVDPLLTLQQYVGLTTPFADTFEQQIVRADY